MTSAVNPWDTESQPSVAHCPARHICLILFGRMVPPLALFVDPTIGLVSVSRRNIDLLQKPPARLDAADSCRALSHELNNGRPPCHVRHHGNFGVQPKRA